MKRLISPIIIILLLIVLVFSLQPAQVMAKVISWISNSSIFSNTIVGNTSPALPSPAPSDRKVGLFYNDPRAWTGYTLLAPKQLNDTYLINNQGQYVNKWHSGYKPGQSAYLLPNGRMIRAGSTVNPNVDTGGGDGGHIEEYDWTGTMTWSLDWTTDTYVQHHDFVPMPNGNVLMLVAEKYTYAQALQAGFKPSILNAVQTKGYILPDSVIEVNRDKQVVWEWHVWDHLIQADNSSADNYVPTLAQVTANPQLIDPNLGGNIAVFWNHMNSLTYNPTLDQVMVSCRGNSEIWVIDHSTTTAQSAGHSGGNYGKGGDLLYRWGNPSQIGTSGTQTLYDQHCGMWIPADYPGAGNMLIFNNGIKRPGGEFSSIDEIIPPVDASGNYTLSGSYYGPASAVWSYQANPPTSFKSLEISGAQRLPNGNTLICSGVNGVLFEVTAGGKIVWKYINPTEKDGILNYNEAPPVDPNKADQTMNEVFRVLRYAPDYPGLVGKTLTPIDHIEIGP